MPISVRIPPRFASTPMANESRRRRRLAPSARSCKTWPKSILNLRERVFKDDGSVRDASSTSSPTMRTYRFQDNLDTEVSRRRLGLDRTGHRGRLSMPERLSIISRREKAPPPDPHDSLLEMIGGTPLVKLQNVTGDLDSDVEVWVKLEFLNPGGSVKDRPLVRSSGCTRRR